MALKISVGSGATLATNLLNGEHLQVISPVSLYPLPAGTNFIGLASVQGTVGLTGLLSLASGTEIKSVATIANFPSSYPVLNLVSVASINGKIDIGTIDTVPTHAVTQSGAWNVGVTGLISLASGTSILVGNTITETNSAAIKTAVETIDNAIAGTEMQVDVITMPTTTVQATNLDIRDLTSVSDSVSAVQSGTWNTGITGLISLASGTLVGLNAGTNHIGSVSIFGNINTTAGAVTLYPGPNQIGSVTVSNFPATQAVSFSQLVSLASGTLVGLNPSSNHIGSVSIFGTVQTSAGAVTLYPGPNQIGSVTVSNVVSVAQSGTWDEVGINDSGNSITVDNGGTFAVQAEQSGTWNVGVTGLISLASGTSVLTSFAGLISLASGTEVRALATINNWPATQAVSFSQLVSLASGTFVSLNAGTTNIGDVDVLSIAAGDNNIGNVDIVSLPATPAGTNYIGLASVSGNVNATQTGTWTVQPGNTANSTPWLVTNSGGLISLASGTFVSLNAGTNNIGDIDVLSIAAGDNNIGNVDVVTLPATPAGTNFIGLVSIQGNVAISNLLSLASGTEVRTRPVSNVTLNASNAYIGLASVNIGGTLPALTAGSAFVGLVSVQGNVNIQSGATVSPLPISTYTSFATIYSASGNATLFVPTASTRWVLKDLLIGSQGNQVVSIKSGTQELFPPISLATMGGYIMNNGDSGLRAKAVNEAFVLNLGATATLSVLANVRFE